ncbi:MAG: hypothetical protein GY790_13890 [Bacteroidetes bacterium]|nr:hypothetical protein [Bacteroidota bacterium]
MSKTRTLLTYHDLTVEVETTPPQELIDHVHSTTLGQPGSFRYQHVDLVDRLTAPGENYFMLLRKSGKMMGSVGFVGRHTQSGGVEHDSWMIRYFSIKAPLRTVPRKRKEKADLKDENKRTTVLGRLFQPIVAHPSQLRGEEDAEKPSIVYGLIDQKNLRSMNFSAQMGMDTIGEVANFSFSRLRPRASERVEQLPDSEKEHMANLLHDYYRGYNLFFSDKLFKDQGYYVIRDSGRVVAGIQEYPVTWRIVDFGSAAVNRLMRLLTKISWVKRRINSDEVKMLAFDGIYCEPGYENVLYELMEGVLARTGRYLAMLMMDRKSDLYRMFQNQGHFGPVNLVLGTFMADVRVRFINIPDKVRQKFLSQPTYIPTYDNS